MAFWGYTFIFDSIPSEMYNLFISSPDGGMVETNGSGDVQLLTQTVFRNPKPYLLGVQQAPVLSFDVMFTSPDELMVDDIRAIQSWLFGQQIYKKLQIVQYDMQDIYFNCFLTAPQIIRTGNLIKGISGTVVCDSPFAWLFPKKFSLTSFSGISDDTVVINNVSDNNYYEYPFIYVKMDGFGGSCTITNITDSSRVFELTGLSAGEEITIDNERNIIVSSTGLLRLGNFNKKWFRLLKGANTVNFHGNYETVEITYSPARKVA